MTEKTTAGLEGRSRGADTAYPLPQERPRRLRSTPALRRLVAQTRLHPADLILPVFVRDGISQPQPISSMPGVFQHTPDSLVTAVREAVALGVGGVMVFGVPRAEDKDASGRAGLAPHGVLNAALRRLRAELGDSTVIMSDLCLDEFTDHGHCGVLDDRGGVDNDATLQVYAQMAVAQADAGAHVVGPSGMMDGQVRVVRAALDAAGHHDISVLAYTAKYASGCYGPFREAVASTLQGDRATYQQDPANRVESRRELRLDQAEGADLVMVKPALPYLDVVADLAATADVPVAAYQVSGEYSMIEAAAANGWLDRDRMVLETLTSIRRAGAQMILTYYAAHAARLLGGAR